MNTMNHFRAVRVSRVRLGRADVNVSDFDGMSIRERSGCVCLGGSSAKVSFIFMIEIGSCSEPLFGFHGGNQINLYISVCVCLYSMCLAY